MISGVHALWVHGGGLPMSPYPPPRLAVQGIYGFTAHPIYVGFVLLCAGTAIGFGSVGGLWLVTPMTALVLAAWVLGFERPGLLRRFGAAAARRPLVSLPPAQANPPTVWDRVSIYVLVFLPWVLAFEAVYVLGVPPDAVDAHLAVEED
jgi:hypothetical protein